jgi:L-ascorbate metabolism protein UlaG (beta-lactamase superfamily)
MRHFLCLALLSVLTIGAGAANKPDPVAPPAPPLTVRYYGHAFVYIITTTGVRIAMDPYDEGTGTYQFPARLPADVVLVSNEADDHSGSARLFGSPQVFRSVTAIGRNNARGLYFQGVQTYRDKEGGAQHGTNATFVFQVDGLRFAHLGGIGHVPDSAQRAEIGKVDVLFLPVGNPDLSIVELNKIAADLGAKIIVPIKYKTQFTPDSALRSLDDYLAGRTNVKQLNASEFTLSPADLPATPTIYVPTMAQ